MKVTSNIFPSFQHISSFPPLPFFPFFCFNFLIPPPHLQSIHISLLFAFHTFSGTTYLSEQTQNALQRCCERYPPLPHTSPPASWTHFITSSVSNSQSESLFHSLRHNGQCLDWLCICVCVCASLNH